MKLIFCIPLIVLFQVAFAKRCYVFGMMGFGYAKAFEIKNHNGQVIAKGVGLNPALIAYSLTSVSPFSGVDSANHYSNY